MAQHNSASSSRLPLSSTNLPPAVVDVVLNPALFQIITQYVQHSDDESSSSESNTNNESRFYDTDNFDPDDHSYTRDDHTYTRDSSSEHGSSSSEEEQEAPLPIPIPVAPGQVVRRSARLEQSRGPPLQYRTITHRGQTFHIPLYEPSHPRYNGFDTLPADWYMGYSDED